VITNSPRIRQQYWYRRFIGECPVCGSNKSYRERVYGTRPENINDRTTYLPDAATYDYCDVLPL